MVTTVHDRELNLVRDECTEPVVRENLELQERLVAHEQIKADLEDRLTATRSEVTFFLSLFLFILPSTFLLLMLLAYLCPLSSVRTSFSYCHRAGTCLCSGLPGIIVEKPC